MNILQLLEFEEGFREKPYIDSLGYPTVAIGKRIGPKGASIDLYQFKVSKLMAALWLEEEVAHTVRVANAQEWFKPLSDDRKVVVLSMIYQMGLVGVLKFKNMIKALESRNWKEAEKQALDSLWARQTPERALRHAKVLGGDKLVDVYKGLI